MKVLRSVNGDFCIVQYFSDYLVLSEKSGMLGECVELHFESSYIHSSMKMLIRKAGYTSQFHCPSQKMYRELNAFNEHKERHLARSFRSGARL